MRTVSVKKEYIMKGELKDILKTIIDNDRDILSIKIEKIEPITAYDMFIKSTDEYKAKIIYKYGVLDNETEI